MKGMTEHGLNVIGYLESGFGLGRVARNFARALKQGGMPVQTRTIPLERQVRERGAFADGDPLEFPVNVYFVNADAVRSVRESLSPIERQGRYEIGVWFWELERFPDMLKSAFPVLDEIWVFSSVVENALRSCSPVPVRRVPFPCFPPASGKTRRNENVFTVLCMFDYRSDFERKNPLGALRAFQKAFQGENGPRLVLKSINGGQFPEQCRLLAEAAKDDPRVSLLDEPLSRPALETMIRESSVYLSLHRAEGLGLNLMDAAAQGIPVVSTAFGGHLDFLGDTAELCVDYRRVPARGVIEFYRDVGEWAEPDVDHAARILKRLFENPGETKRLGEEQKRNVERLYDPEDTRRFVRKWLNARPRVAPGRTKPGRFDRLGSELAASRPKRLLVFRTAPDGRVREIIRRAGEACPGATIDLYGRADPGFGHAVAEHRRHPVAGRMHAEDADPETVSLCRSIRYDLGIVPFHDYSGRDYGNVAELAAHLGIGRLIGVGTEGDVFALQEDFPSPAKPQHPEATVCLLANRFTFGYGVDLVVARQARHFLERGYRVRVGCLLADDRMPAMLREEFPGDRFRVDVVPSAAACGALLEKLSPDILVVHAPPFYEVLPEVPRSVFTVFYDHGEPPADLFENSADRVRVRARKIESARHADLRIAVSRFVARDSGVADVRVHFQGNDHLARPPQMFKTLRGGFRKKAGLEDRFIVLNVTRYYHGDRRYKGIDTFARVREALERAAPGPGGETAFVLAGHSGPRDRAWGENRGLRCFSDLDEEELVSAYLDADFYLSTSNWEGYNLGLVQALAFGKAAAASDRGPHRELGVFTSNDPAILAGRIEDAFRRKRVLGSDGDSVIPRVLPWSLTLEVLERCILEALFEKSLCPKRREGFLSSRLEELRRNNTGDRLIDRFPACPQTEPQGIIS